MFTRTSTRGCRRIGLAVFVLLGIGTGLVATATTAVRAEAATSHLFHIRLRWLGRASIAAAVLLSCLALVAGGGRTYAAVSTVGGACGLHVGSPLVTGAAGSRSFEFPIYPADPHQVCSVTAIVEDSLEPTSGPSFTDVAGDPSFESLSFDFAGGPLPLGLLVGWSPYCADPPAPGVLTVTVDGQSASGTLGPMSCDPDFGGHSAISIGPVLPQDTFVDVGIAATTDGLGYWANTASGDVLARGDAVASGFPNNGPFVGMAADPTGHGYWVVAADGDVFNYGGAAFYGSLVGVQLNAPIVGMAPTPDGGGYWLAGADGGVFAFGDAGFYDSLGGMHLNAPVVGIAATPDGHGYWLAAADGGVFSFGSADFYGSMGGTHLNAPVVGIAATPDGHGYWLAAYDGGVFAFGDAPFEGSAANLALAAPVFAIARTPTGRGYWLLGGDGGVFSYDATFYGTVPLVP